MTSKVKSEVKILKGQDAENKVLDYVKRINRPYGAVDISANLKGAVPKPATQKILLALAEKGKITQKTYSKSTFFVANQSDCDVLPENKVKVLAEETDALLESNKTLTAEIKTASAELARIKSTPTDSELVAQIEEVESKVTKLRAHLEPLRAGTPLFSTSELDALDSEWVQWRAEWVRRRKVFYNFWALVSDPLSQPDAVELAEDLGIEYDTPEHLQVERGPLCVVALAQAQASSSKRR
ncbi:TBPIP-domain-containing protein [Multifurca ochricompacta]|uniref:TBPIP-domain-containing protein n=1 Tax=Multifurca ochricompacta TaxID=376703 RepID=A0AAD4M0Q8_9AGAM|nr:TBPIP-domain-containing protein [Multifurca ochricompacta]